eukprot:scaffold24999_cov63-Phaeocystis_antarctica.AAC.11
MYRPSCSCTRGCCTSLGGQTQRSPAHWAAHRRDSRAALWAPSGPRSTLQPRARCAQARERLRPWVASPAAAQDGASDHAAEPDKDVQVLRLVGTQRLRRGLAQLQLDRGAAALVHGHELLQRRGRRGRQLVRLGVGADPTPTPGLTLNPNTSPFTHLVDQPRGQRGLRFEERAELQHALRTAEANSVHQHAREPGRRDQT